MLFRLVSRSLVTMATEYVSGTYSMAFVTVPNMEVGKKIARYEWENKIEEDSELLLMIKTRTTKVSELTDFVKKNHPYDCCEVISSKIDQGNPAYLEWIGKNVPQ